MYKIRYDTIVDFLTELRNDQAKLEEQLELIDARIADVRESAGFDGKYANELKIYLTETYGEIIPSLKSVLQLEIQLYKRYMSDYLENIDTHLHTVLPQNEMELQYNALVSHKQKMEGYDCEVLPLGAKL